MLAPAARPRPVAAPDPPVPSADSAVAGDGPGAAAGGPVGSLPAASGPAPRTRWRAAIADSHRRWSSSRSSPVAPHSTAKRSTGAKSSGTVPPAQ
ncbi:hypothetical protein [Streptomyces scabiei]|uniref:hypothetical protein n=1 Tax=Streptomyces scabiei TaxID=1930 RepID=UPI00031E33DA|nr:MULTISPECIES: hypothetical protein [unclassified Streptomyces]